MTTTFEGYDGYIDRRGCGDELYADQRFRSAMLLRGLDGLATTAEFEIDEEMLDDTANH